MGKRQATILIVDDHRMVREGLRHLLDGARDVAVVGEASDGRTAIELTSKLAPDCVVMDVTMPQMNGIEATRRILAVRPSTKVLGLSMHSDRRYVVECLRAGMVGYLLKESAFEDLLRAVAMVLDGGIYLTSQVATGFIREAIAHWRDGDESAFQVLSTREREVLQLLAEGKSTKDIAFHFELSIKTIETHRKKIMDKLDLHSVAELTKYAIREGLTDL
jgi:DNA-binding NarL/FixJ family response regulator